MANTVTRTLICGNGENDRRYIVMWKLISDTAAEVTASRINIAEGDLGVAPRLIRLTGACSGFSAQLYWKGSSNVYCFQLPSDKDFHFDFSSFGGLPNDAEGPVSGRGDLLATTSGNGNGDSGVIIAEFIKGD